MLSEANSWKVLSKKDVYENNWITVQHHDVINPGGGTGIYGKVHFKNIAVGVIPLDKDYNTWIVGQYRFTLNLYSWEIPEGGCPIGENPLEAAKRELKEETGIVANEWKDIMQFYTSNSVTDEYAKIYIAKDLKFGDAQPEESEDLKMKKIKFSDLFEMAMKGEVTDAMSMCAILKTQHLILKGAL